MATPILAAADAKWIEPGWVKVRKLKLAHGKASHRLVQLSDIHYKGDREAFESVIRQVNALSPEFVLFTGDLIEKTSYLDEALKILSGIKSPLFGVPGNHDYWSHAPMDRFQKTFAESGGKFLIDEQIVSPDRKFTISGASCLVENRFHPTAETGTRRIHLIHYPAWAKKLGNQNFDLVLAGHSHGGQVRLPGYGALLLPFGVDEYDLGLFKTRNGPLYVNPGIGWFPVPIRFNCRPEITVFEI